MVDVSTSVYLATQRGVKGGGVQLNKSAPMVSNVVAIVVGVKHGLGW